VKDAYSADPLFAAKQRPNPSPHLQQFLNLGRDGVAELQNRSRGTTTSRPSLSSASIRSRGWTGPSERPFGRGRGQGAAPASVFNQPALGHHRLGHFLAAELLLHGSQGTIDHPAALDVVRFLDLVELMGVGGAIEAGGRKEPVLRYTAAVEDPRPDSAPGRERCSGSAARRQGREWGGRRLRPGRRPGRSSGHPPRPCGQERTLPGK
jgi:hypothetical protein